jgi:hypothetical protein
MTGWWGLNKATGRNDRTHRTDSNPFGARHHRIFNQTLLTAPCDS